MSLEPRIEAVRARYGLEHSDFWQIPQNKQWVCKHAALEVVATKAGIEWLPPQIIEADAPNLVTSMVVTGKMGDRIEWSTGETNPTNYSVKGKQPAYPWAMAEKRAKDRVVLKLAGIHGLVYSEDEMPNGGDDDRPLNLPKPKSSAELKRNGDWDRLKSDLDSDLADCHSLFALDKLRKDYRERAKAAEWPKAWLESLANEFANAEDAIKKTELTMAG